MTDFVFTLQDQNTGQFADTIASNEAAARFKLGGDWIDVERAPLWAKRELGEMSEIIRLVQDDERAALAAAQAANPMGKAPFTTPEALKTFHDLQAVHRTVQARVHALLKLSASVGL